ncbi:MAG TPA: hypothetical protein VNO32_10300 [Candidatus Acidoferrum sp.]|nr:hypothetical protein [Candidatus Acidoferrum sp.]
MVIDTRKLTRNLQQWYDFSNKTVLFVGAGGRQLFDPAIKTKKLIAIDKDLEALAQLKQSLSTPHPQNPLEVLASNFADVILPGEVVYFEFCLHEMDDPYEALTHAHTLAPDVVVLDHSPESPWAFYAAEEEKVRCSAQAMQNYGIRRRATFRTNQLFADHAELFAKVAAQGTVAVQRAQSFQNMRNITIPMNYEIVLL